MFPKSGAEQVRARVCAARAFAAQRMTTPEGTLPKNETGRRIYCNAQLDAAAIRRFCTPSEEAAQLLRAAYDTMGLSARGYDRIMRVARTIADLTRSERIEAEHIAEAIQLRSLDRKYWR